MTRYYDGELDVPLGQDFVRRKRHGRFSYMLVFFALGVWSATWIAVNPFLIESSFWLGSLIMLVLSIPAGYIMFNMQKNLDLVLGIEFQNALFSSVMREQADFTVIVNHLGAVEYSDAGFEKLFPNMLRNNVMEAMISLGALSRSDTERLYSALLHNHKEHFTFPVPNEAGEAQRMRVYITPLNRPKGFFLWQGRKYVEDRGETVSQVGEVNTQSLSYLKHVQALQDAVPVGIYTTGANGHIRSNNRALELWLGYEVDEMIMKQLGIIDLHYRPDNARFVSDDTSYEHSFYGETLLRHKNGSLIKVYLRHYVSHDESGNMVSAFGVVENLSLA